MHKGILACLILCVVLSGCGSTYYGKGRAFLENEDYEQAIENLSEAVAQNPEKAENWRELGIAHYRKGEFYKALHALQRASLIKPDPKTVFYLGLVYEKREDLDSAINAYRGYMLLKPGGEMAKKVTARIRMLHEKKTAEEVKRALREEERPEVAAIPLNTLAVTYFDAAGLDWTLAVLSRGLAEFLIADLSKAKKLEVVDRPRMVRLLEELEFGKTEHVDQSTAPRVGKLLGAHRVLTGSISASHDQKLRIDAALVSTETVEKDLSPRAIIQAKLADLGYYEGEIDGKIGRMTRAATKAFQTDQGLEADGIAGPKTQAKLKKVHKTATGALVEFCKTGEAEQFFKLEKELAFEIIERIGVGLTQEERDEVKQIPTESLPALLAYCRGLAYMDQGMYPEAEDEFGKATSSDSSFQEAENRLREAKDLSEHRVSAEDLSGFESAFLQSEEVGPRLPDRLGERLSQTNGHLGMIRSPSADDPHTQAAGPGTGTVIIKGDLDKK